MERITSCYFHFVCIKFVWRLKPDSRARLPSSGPTNANLRKLFCIAFDNKVHFVSKQACVELAVVDNIQCMIMTSLHVL